LRSGRSRDYRGESTCLKALNDSARRIAKIGELPVNPAAVAHVVIVRRRPGKGLARRCRGRNSRDGARTAGVGAAEWRHLQTSLNAISTDPADGRQMKGNYTACALFNPAPRHEAEAAIKRYAMSCDL